MADHGCSCGKPHVIHRAPAASSEWEPLYRAEQARANKAEAQLAEIQKSFAAAVDGALKNAPAGSESATALVKSAITAANNAYESVHKAAKQAAEFTEAGVSAATSAAVKAAGSKPAARAKK